MSGADMGAYLLGASIAGENARSLARVKAERAELAFDRERQDLHNSIRRLSVRFYFEALRGVMRQSARRLTKQSLTKMKEKSENGRISISEEELNTLFAHELDYDAANDFAVRNARAIADEMIAREPDCADYIRTALAELESEYK